jgi:hypothetical protein
MLSPCLWPGLGNCPCLLCSPPVVVYKDQSITLPCRAARTASVVVNGEACTQSSKVMSRSMTTRSYDRRSMGDDLFFIRWPCRASFEKE